MFLVHTPKLVCTYTYEYRLGYFNEKRKQNPSLGDDASTAEAAPGRVERDEQGKARPGSTTPNGGPHLELGVYLSLIHI